VQPLSEEIALNHLFKSNRQQLNVSPVYVINYKFVFFLDRLILIQGETMSFKVTEELGLSESLAIDNAEIQAVGKLFDELGRDSDPGDTSIVDASYYSSFLFCDPENVNPIKKEDFLKFMPMMTRQFAEMGFKSKKVKDLYIQKLDKRYFQVRVEWEMLFERDGRTDVFDNIRVTYLLKKEEDSFKIIMQMDHQNLREIVS